MSSKFSWRFTVQSRGMGRQSAVYLRGEDSRELHLQAHELAESLYGKCTECAWCGYHVTTLDGSVVPGGYVSGYTEPRP